MPNVFHTWMDLELLADTLVKMGFVREDVSGESAKPNERGRADRAVPDDWPDDSVGAAENEADPWGNDEPRQENRSQTRSEPRGGGSSRQGGNRSSGGNRSGQRQQGSSRGGGNSEIPVDGQHEDRLGKLWEFGLPDAPECDCGLAAAEVTKPRARWRAWACPVGFTSNYKNKCDYWEYQS